MTAKDAVTSWWILVFMALFLWYRNTGYDRAIAVFVLTLGLLQLIEYGIYSGANPAQGGQAFFITLWLQCLVLAIAVFVYTKMSHESPLRENHVKLVQTIAGWNLFLFAVIFIISLLYTLFSKSQIVGVPQNNEFIQYSWQSSQPIASQTHTTGSAVLENWGWLYLIGIIAPLCILFVYSALTDVESAVLIFYGILATIYVTYVNPPRACTQMWNYLAVGFAFLAWMFGIFKNPPSVSQNNPINIQADTHIES